MAVILPSVYKDGTATVAANGVAVTGQGTMWLNTVLPGDFFGTHKGSPNRILAVNSNTSLTLAYPWLGGAQASAAYEIMYQSDNARMQETARQLLEKLSSGNVDALSGLVGAADRVPIFTGPGTMSLLPAGARGKIVLAANDMNEALSALGPVFGGPTMPSPAGAGVGIPSNDNFDLINVSGLFIISGTFANGYLGAAAASYSGVLEVIQRGAGMVVQIYRRTSNAGIFKRWTSVSDGLSGWSEWFAFENPTLGPVVNSGGFPIGGIIERGSNSNGEYVRYADGTQICWAGGATGPTSGATDIVAGPLFLGPTKLWTFPITFSASATTVGFVTNARSSARWGIVISTITTGMNLRIYSTGSSPSDIAVDCMAIGRWFNS